MKAPFFRYIVYLFCFIGGFLYHNTAQAIDGCCKITQYNGVPRYITLDEGQCNAEQAPWQGLYYTFDVTKIASNDHNECINKDSQTTKASTGPSKPIPPELSVSIPGLGKFSDITCDDPETPCQIPWLAEYIKAIFNYGILIIGILAVIVMMVGGIMWVTAGGNREQISHAKTFITSSVLGATLAFCSYMILFLLNPNLTILKPIGVSYFKTEDLLPMGEPVNITDLVNSPQGSDFSLDESLWQTIPTSPGVCMNSGAKAAPRFIEKLKIAGECLNRIKPGACLSGYGARSISSQVEKFKKNCKEGKCNPPTCNPYPLGVAICPHTSGSAADFNRRVSFYSEASQCLKMAGFCRLCSEAWHWEYPKMSSGCTCD